MNRPLQSWSLGAALIRPLWSGTESPRESLNQGVDGKGGKD